MANTTITNLPLAVSINGTEQIPAVQASSTVRLTVNQVAAYTAAAGFPNLPATITSLPAATTPLSGTEIVPLSQGGVTKQATVAQIGTVTATGSTTARTLPARFADIANVKDFGAVGNGATDDAAAFTAAGSSAASVTVVVPSGTWRLNSDPSPTGNVVWELYPGAIFTGAGTLSGSIISFGKTGFNHGTTIDRANVRGFGSFQGPSSGAATADESNQVDYNLFRIMGDQLDCIAGPGVATKVNGLTTELVFGGSGATGGRHAINGVGILSNPTSATNADRNYVGVQGFLLASTGDTGSAGNTKGAVFGGSFLAQVTSANAYFYNVTACEFNTSLAANAGTYYRSGIQIAATDFSRGSTYDGMISLSDLGSSSAGKWLNAILIGPQNTAHPLDTTDGTIIKTVGTSTIKDVIDVSSYTITGAFIRGTNFIAQPNNLTINGSAASIELGNKTSGNTPFIDFNSSGNNNDYDARIIATGGNSTSGNGGLTFQCGAVILPVDTRVGPLSNYANDAAAAAGGVPVNGLYRNGSVVQIRVV
jgi:hypothetical protein